MGKRQKKRYREKYRKAEVLTAICFLLPAGIYVALLVFHTGNQVHASELLQLQLYYAGT